MTEQAGSCRGRCSILIPLPWWSS